MAHINVRMGGNADEWLERYKKWKPDFKKPLEQCGIQIMRSTDLNFKAEGRPDKWEPLSEITLMNRRKGKGKGSPKILQDTGKLRQSIVASMRGAPGAIYEVTPNTLKIGSNLLYASIHQWGGTIKPKKGKKFISVPLGIYRRGKKKGQPKKTIQLSQIEIPQRKYLIVQPEDEKYFEKIFRGWAQKELGILGGEQA